MKKLFIGLAFLGLMSFATTLNAETHVKAETYVKAVTPEKDIFIGCHTWTICCSGHAAYYAIACTNQEIHVWKSLLCNEE